MAQSPEITGREILPIPDIPTRGKAALDVRDAELRYQRRKRCGAQSHARVLQKQSAGLKQLTFLNRVDHTTGGSS